MAVITPTFSPTNLSSQSSLSTTDAINDIDVGTFLTLMIKELQNQDPLNPLDNKDMLAQISQIREVGATDKLTKTLDSVLLGQNIASATNMIGADISALTDEGESITGIVSRVQIDKGLPKLHIENLPAVLPSRTQGNIEAGTYGYRVVWADDQNNLFGMDFSGENAIQTTGTQGVDRAIQIRNLPVTDTPKFIYRTDATGEEPYELVGVLGDGKQGSFIDVTSDSDRDGSPLVQSFQPVAITSRSYDVRLSNVSAIRPPSL